jgi:hypothetical protein
MSWVWAIQLMQSGLAKNKTRLHLGGPQSRAMTMVCHARSTKVSITFFSPALSKSTLSLLPSTAKTRP